MKKLVLLMIVLSILTSCSRPNERQMLDHFTSHRSDFLEMQEILYELEPVNQRLSYFDLHKGTTNGDEILENIKRLAFKTKIRNIVFSSYESYINFSYQREILSLNPFGVRWGYVFHPELELHPNLVVESLDAMDINKRSHDFFFY